MNIFGIGNDTVEPERIAEKCNRPGFVNRVFSDNEINYCESKKHSSEHFAVRFAAKEAYMKALGSGWSEGADFKEIEVLNEESGAPKIHLHGKTREKFDALNLKSIFVSLSHTSKSAIAFIIITQ